MNLPIEFIMISTDANKENSTKFKQFLDIVLPQYNITTKERICGFLSQVGHESAGMSILEENLNYSATALTKLFSLSRISPEQCRQFGRVDGSHKADQSAIANIIYGGEWGKKNLGNTQPGDGWLFRGRGLKQLTGRSNYTRFATSVGINAIVESPDMLILPEYATLSAGWFWNVNNLNPIADRRDIALLTKKINGGNFGLSNRQKLFDAAMSYKLIL